MDCCVKVTCAFVGVEVDRHKRISDWTKGVSFPISGYVSLDLMVTQQFDVNHYLSVEYSDLVSQQSTFE